MGELLRIVIGDPAKVARQPALGFGNLSKLVASGEL